MNKKIIVIAVVLLAGIIFLAAFLGSAYGKTVTKVVSQTAKKLGAATNFDSLFLPDFLGFTNSGTGSTTAQRSGLPSTSVQDTASYGTCPTSTTGTTTLFSVINPFEATSTVKLSSFEVTGRATTSFTLNIGTTTTAFATNTPNSILDRVLMNANFLGFLIGGSASSTLTNSWQGTGPNSISTSTPGPNAAENIVVGPGEKVTAWAENATHSTVSGAPGGISGSTASLIDIGRSFACTYKLIWER